MTKIRPVVSEHDRRNPPPTTPTVTKVMKANRGRDTALELAMRSALGRESIRGYRLSPAGVPGRPDIAFTRWKVAVFVNGCFWHRCPTCNLPFPKSHEEFWKAKLDRNMARDARKSAELEKMGWIVITCWEHDVKNDLGGCLARIIGSLNERRAGNRHRVSHRPASI